MTIVAVLPCGSVFAADDYSTWGNWRYVYLITKTTAPGANVTTTQTNFPVLVRINPGNFDGLASTADDGSDIRFSLDNGTHLNYQKERWKHTSSTVDTGEFWVLAPSVTGNDTTKIRMYWNKSGSADSSLPGKVFDTANGFRGVWHLNTGAGPRPDATYANDSAKASGSYTSSGGEIAGCDTFVFTSNQYDSVASGKINLSGKNFTIMAWFKMDVAAPSTFYGIAGQGTNATDKGLHFGYRYNAAGGAKYSLGFFNDDLSQAANYSGGTSWHFITGTYSTAGSKPQSLYMDGAQDNTRNSGGNYTGTGVFRIGNTYSGGDYWGGKIDEVVVADSVRSAGWIKLCYQNQRLTNGRDSCTWFSSSFDHNYTWDNSAAAGITAAGGTWGTNSYWTPEADGTILLAWPGAGNSATFAGSDGTWTITISATQDVDSIAFLNSGYTLSGGTAVNLGTGGILVASSKTAAVSTPITGSGGLVKYGAGALTLSGANTYSGVTNLSAGTLQLGASGVIPDGSAVSIANATSTIFDVNGKTEIIGSLAGGGATGGNVSLGAGALTCGGDNTSTSYAGVISGTGSLTKAGTGTLTLSGSNTYSGTTAVSAGKLKLGAAGDATNTPLGTTGAGTTVSSGAVLDLNGYTLGTAEALTLNGAGLTASPAGALTNTGGNASYSGAIALGSAGTITATSSGTLTCSGNVGSGAYALALDGSGTGTMSGILSTPTSVVKNGAGTWTLSNSNTFTGTTTVSAGTLYINGSTASGSDVSVSAGATLGGTGAINGNVSVSGALSPCTTGAGTLTIAGNLTFNSGSTYNVTANGKTAGSGYDRIAATGVSAVITLGGNAALSFTLGFTPTFGDSFVIIDNQGSNAVSGTFNGIAQGGSIVAGYAGSNYNCTLSYAGGTGNDVVVTVASMAATTTEDYPQWHYSKNIFIDTKEGGANIAADQLKFPLLVRLNASNFNFSQTLTNGKDIRFCKSNGDHLAYQIERWDNANSLAEIWVKIDTVRGYNNTQYFTMYWGKSDAADSSSGSTIFDPANGFIGVWHLDEDPSGGAGAVKDATGNGLHATAKGSMTSADLVDGMIGKGHHFDGSNDADSIPYASAMNTANAVTLSAWVKYAAFQNYGRIISHGMPTDADPWTVYDLTTNATNSQLRAEISTGSSGSQVNAAGLNNLSTATWYFMAFTYDKSNMKLYRNGVQDGASVASTIAMSASQTTPLMIGKANSNNCPFNGVIDEAVVSNTARSADWIKLCYETQKTNQTTVLFYEDYSQWTYSKDLFLNTKASGANVANTVVKFPILVRLDSTTMDFTAVRDSGQDLRFSKSDGTTPLYYEIEQWDMANKKASMWVRVDTVYGNDSAHYFKMYWGKNDAVSRSNGKAVFDTGNGCYGVWHLAESSGDVSDATANANMGTNTGTTSADAVIGKGRVFAGASSQKIAHADAASLDLTGDITLSAWINPTTVSATMGIIGKDTTAYNMSITGPDATHDTLRMYINGARYRSTVSSNIAVSSWNYMTAAFSNTGDTVLFYVNGALLGTKVASTAVPPNTSTEFQIGAKQSNQYFNGSIDEARAENAYRNADWIKLCYENQKTGQTLVMYSVEDYSQWSYSRKVNINTSQSGSGSSNLAQNFPTLIRLTGATFPFNQAQDDGRDIRFAKLDGTKISYEIERWDRSNQLAEIWVLLDSVKANSGTQYIRMYWGKSGVTNRSSASTVFSSGNGFIGVWHFKEGGTDTAFDASGNGNHAVPNGFSSASKVTGTIGISRNFNGTGDNFQINNSLLKNVLTAGNNKATISFWFKAASTAASLIVWEGDGAGNGWGTEQECHLSLGAQPTSSVVDNYLSMYFGDGSNNGSGGSPVHPEFAFSDITNWHYATYVIENSGTAAAATLYLDGSSVSASSGTIGMSTSNWNTNTRIGKGGSGTRYFSGTLDELRIININRNADFIKLCYENQKTNQTLVDFDDYNEWSFSKQLFINTSGMGLSGNVVKFPLLVRLDTTLIDFTQARDTGQDLRFSKADGTHLRYEVEKWDKTNKQAIAWVLVDTVKKDDNTQYIRMYWGKSDAIDKSKPNAVFDTSNGFAGVWHLKESSGDVSDATINANTGTNTGTTGADAVIGKGRAFAGASSQKIAHADAATLRLSGTGNITLSAWINPTTLTSTMGIIGKDTTAYNLSITGPDATHDTLRMYLNKARYISTVTSGVAASAWSYVAAAFANTGDTLRFYVNGSLLGTKLSSVTDTPTITSTEFQIGAKQSNQYFNGSIDEARVEIANRSADWIKLCYETQKPTPTVIGIDSSAEMFLPLRMSAFKVNPGDSLDSCIIATKKWTLKFDRFKGGGIKWLSPDSMGVATNQIDTNLFVLMTNGHRSDTGLGKLRLLDSGKVFARLAQDKNVGGQLYTIVYTVLGSGKVFMRVSTYAAANLSPTGGLEFRIINNASANITNTASSAMASGCKYLLHSDAGTNRIDACLELFENWSQATAITGTGSSKYTGIQSSTWKLPAKRSQAWEFMIDFSHCNWNDTTGVEYRVNSYRNPDSMIFYSGRPILEKAWERQMSGHWQLEEGAGDTTFDNSLNSNNGIRPSGATWTWETGKWGRCLSLSGGNDKILVADNPGFDHLVGDGFTILAWIKPTSALSTSSGIFKKFSTGGYSFTGADNGSVQLALNAAVCAGRTSVGSGSWHHVGVVYKRNYSPNDTVRIFIDGKPDTVYAGVKYSFDTSNANVIIGNGFSGLIDDVRFYGNELGDDEIKAIYQLGFSADLGMYSVRADNNNTVHLALDGFTYHRYFPTFQVSNYWSSNQPSSTTPKVYMNGVKLTYEKDYFAVLDDNRNKLTVGFNSIIGDDATRIYISSDDTLSSSTTTAMPQMSWGKISTPSSHFYVKNFTGNTFGGATANQYYLDFKMDNAATGNGGEIYRLKTSKISPLGAADTTATGTLVAVTSSTDSASFGCGKYKIGGSWLRSTANVAAAPTYTVAESSAVRVVLKINNRTLKKGTDSCAIQTWFTCYPTGQIFRWDSVTIPNAVANIDTVRYDVMETYASSNAGTGVPASAVTNAKLYGGRYGATSIQDNAAALLTLSNSDGVIAPSVWDTARIYSITPSPNQGIGTRFVHCSQLANSKKPYQVALSMDIHGAVFTGTTVDSVSKGIGNCTGASPAARLIANGAGSVPATAGDLNNDGFNEREGAYLYQADNANTARFTLTANGDTCRFTPAFRITNYTAVSVPQYVFVNNIAKIKDFGFNAYVKRTENELVLQLADKICANADIYISYDKTLAVTMTDFIAKAGDAAVSLQWSTQSEENNLGFFLFRRIRPAFMDSLRLIKDAIVAPLTDSDEAMSPAMLVKAQIIQEADTAWKQVNRRIIYGAMAGVSYGKRNYTWIDKQVYNDVRYEYKLMAVDFNNNTDVYNRYAAALPHRILPQCFDLRSNYPNPFRQVTYIKFDLPVKTKVMLNVYNIQGRLIKQIIKPGKPLVPGFYRVSWDGKGEGGRALAAGPYIYRLTAQGFAKSKIMIFIK